MSLRTQGKPKISPESVDMPSELNGDFQLQQGELSFSRLQFQGPGTQVNLTGQYDLNGKQFDFQGKARLDAKLSQMVTGWKSILLKPVDPFFHKDGAGTLLPIKISGTGSDLEIGVGFIHKNLGHKGKRQE